MNIKIYVMIYAINTLTTSLHRGLGSFVSHFDANATALCNQEHLLFDAEGSLYWSSNGIDLILTFVRDRRRIFVRWVIVLVVLDALVALLLLDVVVAAVVVVKGREVSMASSIRTVGTRGRG